MSYKTLIILSLVIPVAITLVLASLAKLSRPTDPPGNLGVADGLLQPCPETPNCVCSQSTDEQHSMQPVRFECDGKEAMARLKELVTESTDAKLVTATDVYLHAEYQSSVFSFVDDVEFYVDAENSLIHFRSASRVGYSDWGVNRQRMEKLIRAFQATQ